MKYQALLLAWSLMAWVTCTFGEVWGSELVLGCALSLCAQGALQEYSVEVLATYLGTPGSNGAVACSVLPFSSGTGQRGLLKACTGGWCTVLSGLCALGETCPNGTFWNNSKS